ncbi:uncharacterized protein MCYG_04421 [Microsporum canis CBS 113480]|uniref:Uncharacterized protein n=1 Tax=Arthroderma otae (strain ATCC MYA-4605 / CBS 113480) TaxID=554155 RepID=C5FNI8_ARTOC|nr:uncharacterized protein MCYG_04421 [Microsporum canis CBS 113480]EEQ31602.1 predicted protein [Microsporum canis CBS 113480]
MIETYRKMKKTHVTLFGAESMGERKDIRKVPSLIDYKAGQLSYIIQYFHSARLLKVVVGCYFDREHLSRRSYMYMLYPCYNMQCDDYIYGMYLRTRMLFFSCNTTKDTDCPLKLPEKDVLYYKSDAWDDVQPSSLGKDDKPLLGDGGQHSKL